MKAAESTSRTDELLPIEIYTIARERRKIQSTHYSTEASHLEASQSNKAPIPMMAKTATSDPSSFSAPLLPVWLDMAPLPVLVEFPLGAEPEVAPGLVENTLVALAEPLPEVGGAVVTDILLESEVAVMELEGAVATWTANALAASVWIPIVVSVPETESTSVQTAVPERMAQSSCAMPPVTSGMSWMM